MAQILSPSVTVQEETEDLNKVTEKFTVKSEQTAMELPLNGGSSSSSSHFTKPISETIEEDEDLVLQIKREEEIETEGFVDGNGGSPLTSTSVTLLPRPMEGLQETGPAPFLKKTFEMVEDPRSDPVVSWSPTRNSFIVWDSYKLSENLLPKYFKHKNFASFIRQLNTYGFRKVDTDRWEFANADFQGGKRHLLKNIKRRNRSCNKNHQSEITSANSTAIGLETEIELLKKGQNSLRFEILRVRQQQDESNNQLIAAEERIRHAESRQQHILLFLARAAKDPRFVQRLLLKRKQMKELDTEIGKKQKLIEKEAEASKEPGFERWDASENPIFGLSTDEFDDSFRDKEESNADIDISSVCGVISHNLMEECMNGTENGETTLHDSRIYMELEDLICQK